MPETGLFFGSFNPVHNGHLIIAQYMLQYAGIDEIWFVVTPRSPFKEKETLYDDYRRFDLVNLAIEGSIGMKAMDIEFRLPQPNYTVNTLAALAEKYPDHSFQLIMGSDNLQYFEKWRNYQFILEHYKLIVYPRPGSLETALLFHPSVRQVDAPLMEISSSFIRKAISEGKDMRHFLPEPVYTYVKENRVYL